MNQYKSIEVCRGVAALLVAVFHLSRLYQQNYDEFPFSNITEIGHVGVDFFFVLSGFIIYYVHSSELGSKIYLKNYLIKRFSRVFPFFWFVVGLNLLLIPFVASKELPSTFELLMNLSLLPYKEYFVIGVSWTLQHGILFYALFALLFINRNIGRVVLTLWLMLIIINSSYDDFQIPVVFSTFNIQFFIGLGVAFALERSYLPHSKLLIPVSFGLIFLIGGLELAGILPHSGLLTRVLYGLTFAMVIITCINLEGRYFRAFPSLLLLLGKSSYSVYLLHLFFGGILFKLFSIAGINSLLPLSLSAFLLISLTVYLCHVTSIIVEIPLSKKVRRFLLKKYGSKLELG